MPPQGRFHVTHNINLSVRKRKGFLKKFLRKNREIIRCRYVVENRQVHIGAQRIPLWTIIFGGTATGDYNCNP